MELTAESREFDPRRRFRPNIYWYLTFRCNLACKHCWVESSPWVDTSGDLTTLEAMRVVQQMVELNVGTCIMTGGEVLSRRDALDVLLALTDNGIRVAMETNGLLVSDRFIELARELQAQRLLNITISLDGGTAEAHDRLRGPGTFRRTFAKLGRLTAGGVAYAVQCVLNSSNIETIPVLYERAAELEPGLRTVAFALLNPIGRGEELVGDLGIGFGELTRILGLIEEHKGRFHGCTMVKAPPAAIPPRYLGMVFRDREVETLVSCQFPLLGILPDGAVTVCALSRDNEELHFGNVRTSNLKRIWSERRMDLLRGRYLDTDNLAGICGDCIWKRRCRGACRAWAWEETGNFDAPYPLCAALAEAGQFPAAYRLSRLRAADPGYQPPGGRCICPLSPEVAA